MSKGVRRIKEGNSVKSKGREENGPFQTMNLVARVEDLSTRLPRLLARARDGVGADAAETDQRDLTTALEALIGAAQAAEHKIGEQETWISNLEQMATTDELTGVLNRRGFEGEFRRVLARARRHGEEGILIFVDLDGFKPINDTYGHAAGDQVLRQVARTLSESVRDTDSVARMGGDEFCVLLVKTSRYAGVARAEALKRQINNAFVDWDGRQIAVRASFGIQAFGAEDSAKELLSNADAAMYRIKRIKEQTTEVKATKTRCLTGALPMPGIGHAD